VAIKLGDYLMEQHHHLRYLSFKPHRANVIESISFIKGTDNTSPVIAGVTIEPNSAEPSVKRPMPKPSGSAKYVALPEYRLLPKLVPNQLSAGVFGWQGETDLPNAGINSRETPFKDPRLPFAVPPHAVIIHPGPRNGVVVAWRSPVTAKVRISGRVVDLDASAGDGVAWILDHRKADGVYELARGDILNGGSQGLHEGDHFRQFPQVPVTEGEMLELLVLPKADCGADATLIKWMITSEDGKTTWDISRDLAFDEKKASNPQADSLGNPAVWHFYDMAASTRASLPRPPASIVEAGARSPTPWGSLVLQDAMIVDDFIRIRPGAEIHTRDEFTGPIEIVVEARSVRGRDIRLDAYRGSCVIFNWQDKPSELRVNRPDGQRTDWETGSLATAAVTPLQPNRWYELRWRITRNAMQVSVDGITIFHEARPNLLGGKAHVGIRGFGDLVDVRRVQVLGLDGNREDPAASQPNRPEKLRPIPDADAAKEAQQKIKESYKNDFTKTAAARRSPFASNLLIAGGDATNDPAMRYMLWSDARTQAVIAGNLPLAFRAINALASEYEVDAMKSRLSALETANEDYTTPAARWDLIDTALAVIDHAVASGEAPPAPVIELVTAVVKSDPGLPFASYATTRCEEAQFFHSQRAKAQKALALLETDPNDAAANGTAGKYLALVKGDWMAGLPKLTKGNDATVQSLATADQEGADPVKGADPVRIADGWWNYAKEQHGLVGKNAFRRAHFWYTTAAASKLAAVQRRRVERRIREADDLDNLGPLKQHPQGVNGVLNTSVVDCVKKAFPLRLAKTFDITRSWVLATEFQLTDLKDGSRQIFFWGDDRVGRDPVYVRQIGTQIAFIAGDTVNGTEHEIRFPLTQQHVQRTTRAIFRYKAATQEFDLYIDGQFLRRDRSVIMPTVDKPMPMWLGGVNAKDQRFTGKVLYLWLSN
jgi:hypothetical protein